MLISTATIDKVYELDLVTVISRYGVDLKKKGANYSACCPFHDEKTASFAVSTAKGIYKCFGCGKGGNSPVNFVMHKEGVEWIEAIKILAHNHNLTVEYDNSEQAVAYQVKMQESMRLTDINNWAADYYHQRLSDAPKEALRCSPELADRFNLGYAADGWDNLIKAAQLAGHNQQTLIDLDLVRKGKNTFDVFRNRIVFPIYNEKNMVIGFSGRYLGEEKETAKYLNTAETKVFVKGNELFGLNLSKQKIREKGFAYMVEGNWDVVSAHGFGLENTIAACGTALTPAQCRLLRKYCNHIVFIYDADKAGRNALLKNLPVAVEAGFTVECVILPEGQDPDDYFRNTKPGNDVYAQVHLLHKDGIEYFAEVKNKHVKNVRERSDLFNDLAALLCFIDDENIINDYCKTIAKQCGFELKDFRREAHRMKEEREVNTIDEDDVPLPEGVNREEFEKHGFYGISKDGKAGYYFWNTGAHKFIAFSNFVITPLHHIYSKMDNKRLVEIDNGRYKTILDLPSKALVGIQQFRELMYQEGNYRFDGNATHLNKIVAKISEQFPRCEELKTLGWQQEGFYAFSDGIYNGNFMKVNQHGVVMHKEKHFFLPAFSSIYADVREEDDQYENDRWFKYNYVHKNNFERWSRLMVDAYGEKGMFGVAFLLSSLFRDMIYSKYKIFPHLFLFGEKGSGKSQLGWSLNNVFWNSQPGFNLTAGTNVGFYRKLARARNSIVWFDEYNDYIDPKRFQALKSAYDGIGHEKGVMSRDNRTESTKVNSACVISGQYLPTLDDNALFTRSVLLTFRKDDWQGKPEVSRAYSDLKQMEEGGLSGVIADVVKFRDLMEAKYAAAFQQEFTRMKEEVEDYNERILRNFITLITSVKVLEEVIPLPFTYKQIYALSKAMIIEQSAQINESEALSQFWMMIEFLFRDKKINWDQSREKGKQQVNIDFKIETREEIKIMVNRKEEQAVVLQKKQRLLFIRFTKVHPLYMEMHRKQHGHNGMAMSSLKTYIHGHKAFIGLTRSTTFDDGVSSAYVFLYDELGINLEVNSDQDDNGRPF